MLAEDHAVVREGLRSLIESESDMQVVAEAGDGHQAVSLFQEKNPDLLLLDVRMPGLDGCRVIAAVRSRTPHARILVLSAFSGEEEVSRCLRAGALGYMLKASSRADLIEAIRTVSRGRRVIPKEIAAKAVDSITVPSLTTRETEVLQLVSKGMSNRAISESLRISEGTAKAHLHNILRKLDVNSRTEAVAVARRRGVLRG